MYCTFTSNETNDSKDEKLLITLSFGIFNLYLIEYIYKISIYIADENSMGCGSSSTAGPKSGKPQNQTSTRPQENRVRKK
jgi:hypothetical protein